MAEWLYGRNPIYETLRAARRPLFELRLAQGAKEDGRLKEIVDLAAGQGVSIQRVPRGQLDGIAAHHQGVVLQAGDYPYSDLPSMLAQAKQRKQPPFLLLLDTLQDPQNLGTLLRTAEATGVHGVVLPPRRAAGVTPAVVNASSGASEHLLIAQMNLAQAIKQLKEAGLWVVGLDQAKEAQPPGQLRLDGALAVVVGSEGQGMRRLVRESCDLLLRLPMGGQVESLNAAVAGSIALYLAWQARGYA